ncbi:MULTISPECIES: AAA family ATPase [unclassified Thioalkalivibrio]|uniref:AAA family ATPase n=1 Tax=unclassified Thioalkalivibrio TaxID=2621013 RepID=UPI0003A15557|nr:MULTISPECIES: AAA family ATPase [unclassified Thioalkalivibrio]
MLLKSLSLYNFRQFYGENSIHFARDSVRNVTLIHAENGVGKTTLLNAIQWCLFGKLNSDFEQPEDLVSYEAKKENRKTSRVEVEFEYEGEEYLAQRHFEIGRKETKFKLFWIQSHNYKEVPNPSNFVNSILPKDMANYFFFHGEGISSISDARTGDKFRRAVRDILGFTFAEAAIDDLKSIKVQYGKKAKELDLRNDALRQAAEKKIEAEQKLHEITDEQEKVKEELQSRQEELEDLESKLSKSGNADVTRIKRELDNACRRIDRDNRELSSCFADRQALISKYGWAVFGSGLAGEGLEFIDESTLKGRIPSPYQETFVQDLLNQGECICGRPLEGGGEAYTRVVSLLETANTALMSQRVMKARSAADNMAGVAEEFLNKVEEIESKRRRLDKDLAGAEQVRNELEEELDAVDESEIQRMNEARRKAQSKRDESLREDERLNVRKKQREREFEQANRELQARGGGDEQLERLSAIQELIENMMIRCRKRLDEFEESARGTIAKTVDRFLERFSRDDYSVRVNSAFEFVLVRRSDGGIVPKSKGENLLLNLAFVSALIDMAYKREKASGDFLVQGTVAPFVIDAPFGELDDTYRAATAEFLPQTAKQLVLLLSSSHWKGTVDDAIREKVGAEYVLVSHKRVEQGDKPKDLLHIHGHEYAQSIYGAERDCTEVTEVL